MPIKGTFPNTLSATTSKISSLEIPFTILDTVQVLSASLINIGPSILFIKIALYTVSACDDVGLLTKLNINSIF